MKYKIINSKKGQIFIMLLVIGVLVLTGYAIFTFLTHQTSLGEVEAPLLLSSMNNGAERFLFFAEESAKLSLANAYNDIAVENKFPASTCSYENDYINFCGIAADLEQQLASKSKQYLDTMIKTYPEQQFSDIQLKVQFDAGALIVSGEKKLHTSIEEGSFPYGAVYDFKPSFEVKLDELKLTSFQEIRDNALQCAKSPEQEIAECMKDSQFSVSASKNGKKTFFTLTSKERFLIISKDKAEYKPITIAFFTEN